MTHERSDQAASDGARGPAYARFVLVMLTLVYTLNFLDRTILATLAQAVKVDLKLTDTELGLLQGFAFALLYTTLGIPIARMAERWNRISIISVSMALWSVMTAVCGMATNFVQLFLARVGVGVGEAGCSPPAHSVIADYFPPESRARAYAVYSFGIPLGTMIGAIFGGWLAQNFDWRIAFLVMGLPGVLFAIIFKLMVREPERGGKDPANVRAAANAPPPSISEAARQLWGKASLRHVTLGVTLTAFAGYGAGSFAQAYFLRAFTLDYAQVGLIFGLIGGIAAGIGTLGGGWLADIAVKRNAAWYCLVPAFSLLLAAPLYIYAYTLGAWQDAALWLILPTLLHYIYLGPTLGAMHNLIEARARATATALLYFFLNLIALGGGPFFTGAVIDFFSRRAFSGLHAGDFIALCPGGQAGAGASAELASACAEALVDGSRYGIIVTLVILFWAALHYLLAARTLGQDLQKFRQGRAEAAAANPS